MAGDKDHNYLYVGALELWDKVLYFKEAIFTYTGRPESRIQTPYPVVSGF